MENTSKPSKSYLQNGLFYGLVMILTFVIIYALNIDIMKNKMIGTTSSILNYLFLPLLFIYLGCLDFKKNNNGFMSFVESLKVGISIVFLAAILFAAFNVIFNLIFPEYLDEILRNTRTIMLEQNPQMTNEQVEMAISMTKKFSAPWFSFPITIAVFSFLGLIYSLIIGMIVKNDNPQGL
jgi:hypothetical protein